jgi:hypothetical protein
MMEVLRREVLLIAFGSYVFLVLNFRRGVMVMVVVMH